MNKRKLKRIIREEVKNILREGSWKLPLSVRAAKDLDRAVRRKGVDITAQEVRDLPIGTDMLWNSLDSGGDPYNALYRAIRNFVELPEDRFFNKKPDPKAREILRKTVKHMERKRL